jgi:hypothetical protein
MDVHTFLSRRAAALQHAKAWPRMKEFRKKMAFRGNWSSYVAPRFGMLKVEKKEEPGASGTLARRTRENLIVPAPAPVSNNSHLPCRSVISVPIGFF